MDRAAIAALAALDDDVRAALFRCVRESNGPVTREQAAAAVGVSRKLAAFHLDRLVAVGLLDARIEPAGRVGRAPKVYEPSRADVAVSVPQREPGLLAAILIDAVLAQRDGEPAARAAMRVARARGRAAGSTERDRMRPGRLGPERALTALAGALERCGFDPARDGDAVRLRACPFHPMAATAPELVCGINHAYACGLLAGLQAPQSVRAVLVPGAGACCVEFRRAASS